MNEQSYIKFGTLTTHSYEVTFGPGTLGINLQATRAGFGNNFLTRLKYDNFTQKKKIQVDMLIHFIGQPMAPY